ncbi:MAG: AAA family ATPase, partial [Rhodospirillales bacterium]|nr:AAA family ATPase [Rhodospirillales bacterium]
MARREAHFVCQQCGAAHPRWSGKCDACGAWNSIVEEPAVETAPLGAKARGSARASKRLAFVGLEGEAEQAPRRATGNAEFDRVCGGGLVAGSAVLVGGDPGIGKSTLLLQIAAALSADAQIAYISGEEAVDQIRMRAARLGLAKSGVALAAATNLRDVLAS